MSVIYKAVSKAVICLHFKQSFNTFGFSIVTVYWYTSWWLRATSHHVKRPSRYCIELTSYIYR